jgi:cytochrome c-type biogenesis protein CcmF
VVSSVHSFAQSPIGAWFLGFLALATGLTAWLIVNRLDYLRTKARLESVISRESSFLFNNLIFVAACFAVLWGTLFPVLSEAVTGEKISVDAPFFNRINVPLGLLLLFLTGVGPLLAWRRTSVDGLKRNFLRPAVGGLALMVVLAVAGVRHPYALIAFGLALFVAWTIVAEFYRGARAIRARSGMNPLAAVVELTLRNTRRYGGYLVHMGVVLMFVGFAGSAFNRHQTHELAVGDKAEVGRYRLRMAELRDGENENYSWDHAVIEVFRDGRKIATLEPERRFYKASRQPTSEVAIRRGLREDLYLNFAGLSEDNRRAVIQAYVFPLVSWIWIGFAVLVFGGLVCLLPDKAREATRRAAAREETAEEYAPAP